MNLQSKDIKKKIGMLPLEQQKEVLALLEQYEQVKSKEESQKELIPFVRAMWSEFIGGEHHEIMAEAFEKVASGDLKRLIIEFFLQLKHLVTCQSFHIFYLDLFLNE